MKKSLHDLRRLQQSKDREKQKLRRKKGRKGKRQRGKQIGQGKTKFNFQEVNINSLPNDKIVDVTKLKSFADNKMNKAQKMISVFHRVENSVGKGENAGYQHFLLLPQCFQKASFLGSLIVGIVWLRAKH